MTALAALATPSVLTWSVAALATLGVIARPFGWPEAVWAVLGAAALVLLGLLPVASAWAGVLRGTDVYLFLTGMMLVSEAARREGLFDWLAGLAVRAARGSATRLFLLVYAVGTLVTVFLSNDACAVVLTPAVAAAARTARVRDPLPYLFVCAFVANAASFVLPISNPANLVVYAERMPPLSRWLALFALPSALAILATYAALRWATARALAAETVAGEVAPVRLTRTGAVTGLGIVATAGVLVAASARGLDLGAPTFAAGLATTGLALGLSRGGLVAGGWSVVRGVSWGVLPLVAGLFVLVEALTATGAVAALGRALGAAARAAPGATGWGAGALVALACNLVNNLPAGLVAGAAVGAAGVDERLAGAILIGVDLGPNLSVTGSLATILWLAAIRREGQEVGAWRFLRLGLLVMPPALVLALAGLLVPA